MLLPERVRSASERESARPGAVTRWNWVEPSFLLCFFMARKRRGRFWFWLLLLFKKTTTTKGVIVYMYCIVCTIIHIHLLFLVWFRCGYRGKLSFFFGCFVLVRRARRGIFLQYGRFRDRLVSVSRERVKKCRRAPGRRERNKTDRQIRQTDKKRKP